MSESIAHAERPAHVVFNRHSHISVKFEPELAHPITRIADRRQDFARRLGEDGGLLIDKGDLRPTNFIKGPGQLGSGGFGGSEMPFTVPPAAVAQIGESATDFDQSIDCTTADKIG